MEIVGLKKKFEKSKAQVMFNESSVILNEILKCQRSPFNTSGLGYKKVDDKTREVKWSPKTPEVGSTSLKEESKATHAPAQENETFEISSMHQETRPSLQSKLRREVSPRWKQSPRYENRFNCYCYSCNNFGHRAMDCTFQGRKHTGS